VVNGRVHKGALRDKVLESLYIRSGYHKADCMRMKIGNLEDNPGKRAHGYCRPCMTINGVKTKMPHVKVKNYLGCGCPGDHDKENMLCDYTNITRLLEELPVEKAEQSLFWNDMNKGNEWSEGYGIMHEDNVAKALQRINVREKIDPAKHYTSDMGRKTFVTLTTKFLGFAEDITKLTTHHVEDDMVHVYQDPNYHNVQRATIVGRVFQLYNQGLYFPPIPDTMPHVLQGVRNAVSILQRQNKQIM
jgi:hypothetical protein